MYERTNESARVVSHVGVLLCCGGVRGYTHTHISFDLSLCVVTCVTRHARTHTKKIRVRISNTTDSYIDELLGNSSYIR